MLKEITTELITVLIFLLLILLIGYVIAAIVLLDGNYFRWNDVERLYSFMAGIVSWITYTYVKSTSFKRN